MKRSEVRTFINSGILTLIESFSYGSGRISEWNSDRGNSYPMIWLDEETFQPSTELANNTLPQDSWTINLHIARKDAVDSSPEQYTALIDDCDFTAQKLINIYNVSLSSSEEVAITNITRSPFIKKNADCLTGVMLSFTLVAPDKTNLC